ncbi:MAG: hypothetical protein WCQ53_05050, partial [bacterium]
MRFRPYTFMIVPQDSKRVFKIKIPFYAMITGLAIICVVGFMLMYVVFDYMYVMSGFQSIEDMKVRNRKLGKQLYSYKMRIDEIENTMERLKTLTTKLKIISNLGDSEDRDKNLYSEADVIEGIDDFSMSSDAEIDGEFRNMQGKLKDIEYKMAYQEEELNKFSEYLAEQSALLAATPSIIPVKGWITSYFGSRLDPFTRKIARHDGIDISTRLG